MATIISAGVVVAANERMDIWQPGYVIVQDGRIAEAGPGSGPHGDFVDRINDPSSILMPGLVNAHTHSPSNLLKGTWSRMPLEIWRQYIRAGWREYSDEAIYVSAQLGIAGDDPHRVHLRARSFLHRFIEPPHGRVACSSGYGGRRHARRARADLVRSRV